MPETPKPRLKSIDDLFTMNATETLPASANAVVSVAIDTLTPFKGHPFKLYEGERLSDMIESIRANGVLIPIIVRKLDNILEILSGHNRSNASKLAGNGEIPTIILENISDEKARAYVIETNLIQRSFSEMSHSEKAAVLELHHSKLFSQGKRKDVLLELEQLTNPHKHTENATCSQVANSRKTITKVGQEYGLSKDTVARYLRINHLIPELKTRLDNDDLAFIPAVELSYLKESEQELVYNCVNEYGFAVTLKRADALRSLAGRLDSDNVYSLLSGENVPKKTGTPKIKVSKTVYSKYFTPKQSAKEVQCIVEQALEFYFNREGA